MAGDIADTCTAQAWAAAGGSPELADAVTYEGAGPVLAARLPVRELARATVGACSLAAAELLAARNSAPLPEVRVSEGAVATAFVSERHLRIDGTGGVSFAPLSGFWPAADGWVRTHANYPHHRARLLAVLGLADPGDEPAAAEALAPALAAELAARPARRIQEDVYAAGGLAVAVAPAPAVTAAAVDAPAATIAPATEQGMTGPALIEIRPGAASGRRPLGPASLPARGVRVLDLTRVIAGPVGTRVLALLGADVLRIDAPGRAPDAAAHLDTGFGKRSALLDLSDPGEREVFDGLLESADVVVLGYRPGALDRYGLAASQLLARRPDLIVAELSAWGWAGNWAGRRGFDSLVQAATGIAALEAGADGRPGVLPAQALDHGTGYLLAAGVLRALTEHHLTGAGRWLRLSLAGTASWLITGISPAPEPGGQYDPERWLTQTAAPYGTVRHAMSPIGYAGAPPTWSRAPSPWGSDPPAWQAESRPGTRDQDRLAVAADAGEDKRGVVLKALAELLGNRLNGDGQRRAGLA